MLAMNHQNPAKKNPARGNMPGSLKYPILRTGRRNARSGRERVSTASAHYMRLTTREKVHGGINIPGCF